VAGPPAIAGEGARDSGSPAHGDGGRGAARSEVGGRQTQGSRAVPGTHAVDRVAQGDLFPVVVEGELERLGVQIARRDAEQAHPASAQVELGEQLEDRVVDETGAHRRRRQGAAAGQRVEGAVAHLEGDCARREAPGAQARHGGVGEREQRRAQELGVVDVFGERHLVAERLGRRVPGAHRGAAAARGEPLEAVGALAEGGRQHGEGDVLQGAHRGQPQRAQTLLGDRADAPDLADRQLAQAAVDVVVGQLTDAAGLVEAGGDLGQQLGGADAERAGETVLVADQLLQAAGDRLRRSEEAPAAGHIEERLVDGDRLDQVGEAPVELLQVAMRGGVGGHVDRQVHPLGTEALRPRDGHRRAHPARPRLVGGRGHHPA
jgi:hypothetical protein